MRKPFIVRPTGLKGNDKLDRMKELMGMSSLNEDVKNSVVELTKLGPDGKVYGIVREGHNYFIKVTDKKSNIVTEDFNYIGGLMNKTSEAYPTYAKAIKQLNLKFMSLNEAYGKQGNFNVFEDDNLLTEHHPYKADQALSATKGMGDGAEYVVDKAGVELSYDSKEGKDDSQFGDNLADKDVMDEFESVKLSENEMAIENMLGGEDLGENYHDEWAARDMMKNLGYDEPYENPTKMSPEELEQFKSSAKASDEMPEGPKSLYGDQVTENVNIAQIKNTKEFQNLVNYFKQNPDEAEEVKDDLGSTNEAESWSKSTYKDAYRTGDGVYSTYVYQKNGKYYKEQDLPQGKSKTVEISKEEFKEVRKQYIKDKLLNVGMGAAGLGFVGALMAGPLATMNPGEILQAVLIAAGIGAGATAALTEDSLSEAEEIKKKFEKEYGKEGEGIYYATAKAQDRDPKTFEKLKESRKGFSIQTALEKMDSIIEEVTTDKVSEILNSLTESEKEALLSTLKKKV